MAETAVSKILFELVKKDKLLDKYLKDLSVKKVIFVKNRLMNILVWQKKKF